MSAAAATKRDDQRGVAQLLPHVGGPGELGHCFPVDELHWNCSWDEEHGHAVYVKDGEVVNVDIPGEGWPDADDE